MFHNIADDLAKTYTSSPDYYYIYNGVCTHSQLLNCDFGWLTVPQRAYLALPVDDMAFPSQHCLHYTYQHDSKTMVPRTSRNYD